MENRWSDRNMYTPWCHTIVLITIGEQSLLIPCFDSNLLAAHGRLIQCFAKLVFINSMHLALPSSSSSMSDSSNKSNIHSPKWQTNSQSKTTYVHTVYGVDLQGQVDWKGQEKSEAFESTSRIISWPYSVLVPECPSYELVVSCSLSLIYKMLRLDFGHMISLVDPLCLNAVVKYWVSLLGLCLY